MPTTEGSLGYAAEVWSRRLLAEHVRGNCVKAGHPCLSRAAKATVHRILSERCLRPEKIRYYLEKRDPNFEGNYSGTPNINAPQKRANHL